MRRSRGRELRQRRVRAMRRPARLSERRNAAPAGKPPAEEQWEALGSVPESRAKRASTRDFDRAAYTQSLHMKNSPSPKRSPKGGEGTRARIAVVPCLLYETERLPTRDQNEIRS